jgi:hypothetical protein
MYCLLLTLSHPDYFTTRWIYGDEPEFAEEHLLTIKRMQKASPAVLGGDGVKETMSQISDALSLGKQWTDFRTSGTKVEEAKLELERKKWEFEKQKEAEAKREDLENLQHDITRAKLELELEKLKTQRGEEIRKRHQAQQNEFREYFARLISSVKILDHMPEQLVHELRSALYSEIEQLQKLGFSVVEVKTLEASSDAQDQRN